MSINFLWFTWAMQYCSLFTKNTLHAPYHVWLQPFSDDLFTRRRSLSSRTEKSSQARQRVRMVPRGED